LVYAHSQKKLSEKLVYFTEYYCFDNKNQWETCIAVSQFLKRLEMNFARMFIDPRKTQFFIKGLYRRLVILWYKILNFLEYFCYGVNEMFWFGFRINRLTHLFTYFIQVKVSAPSILEGYIWKFGRWSCGSWVLDYLNVLDFELEIRTAINMIKQFYWKF